MQSDTTWKKAEKFVRVGFWGANVGRALVIILGLFPGGVIHLCPRAQRRNPNAISIWSGTILD
jgi:hypothetical protein